jgi:transposase
MNEAPRQVRTTFEQLKKQHLTQCLQLKHIRNNYYIHHITSQWDKQRHKTVKHSEHIGKITQNGIYIPKKSTIHESKREVHEYANATLVHNLLSDVEAILKESNMPHYQDIIAAATIKAITPSPIRLLQTRWEKFYLSKNTHANLQEKHVSDLLKDAGGNIARWYDLFSKLPSETNLLLYDLTTIFTHSQLLKFAEKGYNANHQYQNQIGIIMAFNCKDHLPVAMDVFYGSMKDISTIRDFIQRLPEAQNRSLGFILDRGFSSYELLNDFKAQKISYVVPLKKNSTLLKVEDLKWKGTFLYRDRPIRWAIGGCEFGGLYVFEDPHLKGEEEAALLRRVGDKRLSMAMFEEKRKVAGVIALVSDLKMRASKMYDLYKGREEVELAFDALKNTLDADSTYLRCEDSVRGFFFVSFLAMRVYFKLLRRLKERHLTSKISVEEVLFELSKIERITEDRTGREYYASIPKRARYMLSLFSDLIPMG